VEARRGWTYVRFMRDWERYRLDRRYYMPTGRAAVTERAPPTCPNGHPLGPDRVLMGCT